MYLFEKRKSEPHCKFVAQMMTRGRSGQSCSVAGASAKNVLRPDVPGL
jgi:hypothetical protein